MTGICPQKIYIKYMLYTWYIYGWLQVGTLFSTITNMQITSSLLLDTISLNIGLNLKFYAMDWFGGLYRLGLIDQCILPSEKDNCEYFEDVFYVLKELEVCYSCYCN